MTTLAEATYRVYVDWFRVFRREMNRWVRAVLASFGNSPLARLKYHKIGPFAYLWEFDRMSDVLVRNMGQWTREVFKEQHIRHRDYFPQGRSPPYSGGLTALRGGTTYAPPRWVRGPSVNPKLLF